MELETAMYVSSLTLWSLDSLGVVLGRWGGVGWSLIGWLGGALAYLVLCFFLCGSVRRPRGYASP